MLIKEGASVRGLKSCMVIVWLIVDSVYKKYGQNAVITSGSDGVHSKNSKHYTGEGLDFRIHYFDKSTQKKVYKEIVSHLDETKYDIILESDHIHIEYDPDDENELTETCNK